MLFKQISLQAVIKFLLSKNIKFTLESCPIDPTVIQFVVSKKYVETEPFIINKEDIELMQARQQCSGEILMYYDLENSKIIGCCFTWQQYFKTIDTKACINLSLRQAIENRYADNLQLETSKAQ